jgi:hypothetical protein
MGSFASQSSPKQTNPTKLFASHPNYLLEVTGKRDFLCLKQLSPLGFLHPPRERWGKKKQNPSPQNSPERFNDNNAQQSVLQQKRVQQRASSLI